MIYATYLSLGKVLGFADSGYCAFKILQQIAIKYNKVQ